MVLWRARSCLFLVSVIDGRDYCGLLSQGTWLIANIDDEEMMHVCRGRWVAEVDACMAKKGGCRIIRMQFEYALSSIVKHNCDVYGVFGWDLDA